MTTTLHVHAEKVRSFLAGFLAVLSFFIFRELSKSILLLVLGIAVAIIAIAIARSTAHHFHGAHVHSGDSPLDVLAPSILIAVNIFHPAIDGFSIYETFQRGGAAAGIVTIIGVVLHEIVRQWALIIAFQKMHIKRSWLVVTSALFGIAGGIGLGLIGTQVLENHESIIDLATIFAYAFIIAEFWYADHHEHKATSTWFMVAVGVALAGVLAFVFGGH